MTANGADLGVKNSMDLFISDLSDADWKEEDALFFNIIKFIKLG